MVQARNQVATGVHTPDSVSPTVAEAAELWLRRCERDKLERTTLLQYRGHLTHHIGPRLGAVKLSRLTVPLINEFADQLLTAGRSRVLVSRGMVSLSSIVAEAQRRGLVTANNVRSAKPVRRSSREDKRPEMPSRDELKAIIAATPDQWRPLILTAIFTGLRGSELRGLLWEDVDLKRGVLQCSPKGRSLQHLRAAEVQGWHPRYPAAAKPADHATDICSRRGTTRRP